VSIAAFNKWLNSIPQLIPGLEACYRLKSFAPSWSSPEERPKFGPMLFKDIMAAAQVDPALDDLAFYDWLKKSVNDIWVINTTWLISGMIGEGPKLYCPSARECDAFSQVEASVPWGEYRQPFDTTTLILPEGFRFSRQDQLSPDVGTPFAISARTRREGNYMCLLVHCTGERSLSTTRVFKSDDVLMEEEIVGDTLTQGDSEAIRDAMRIMANACMLLTQAGARKLGRTNEDAARRLEAKLGKKLPPAAAKANERALRLIPVVYGFDQHVQIYDEGKEEAPEGEAQGGYSLKPHWRRGYWQRQPCGEGRRERKLQFRKPLLVNAHLLAGPLRNTRVTMTRPGAA
jgi:hypothetical protein